ncbi:hypothetical protein [Serratia rhizosphaerae]|uniref:Lipoprotein n=1 Tax=Serratia rhizosphaerae TaxID=2597702 RepID=A0ABX6GPQ4_9GAMM|nr:hypothetical protein [Serratia rhizosphaerae]QHA88228.1 hypothetical protein FO014_15370 [Serratia rhizosphaerae]
MKHLQITNKHAHLLIGVMMAGSLLLTGCQSKKTRSLVSPPVAVAPAPAPVASPPPEKKESRITLCQSELASLKKVNPKAYALRKAYFDSLVNSVSVYGAVRGDVNALTKDTLDALYKYKTNQACSMIERDVLDALIRKGESVK